MLASLVTAWTYALVVSAALFAVVVLVQGIARGIRALAHAGQRQARRTGTSLQAAPPAAPALSQAA